MEVLVLLIRALADLAVNKPKGEGIHRYLSEERRRILILRISLAILESKRKFNRAEFQVGVEEEWPREIRSFRRRMRWG